MTQQSLLFSSDAAPLAEFSPCRNYRYTLWRHFNPGPRYVQFICLNPSTADEVKNDNTIVKCMNFAKRWGYDAMVMTNLFAFRATNPYVMKRAADPIGKENNRWILETANKADLIIAAWSTTHGSFLDRDLFVKDLLKGRLSCLRKNDKNKPWHPLYLRGDIKPIPYA